MAITLTYSTTTIELHQDLFWSDRNSWHPVEQTAQRSITGALIVQSGERIQGRPITLQPVDESSAWMTGTVLEALRVWAAVPGRQMTLSFDGDNYGVIFRHQDGAIDATPVVLFRDAEGVDKYHVTIRLQQVS